MKKKNKCALLSLILAAVTVLQAVYNPFYKGLYPKFKKIFGGDGILDESMYDLHIIVVWFIAVVISVLALISAIMFYCTDEKSPKAMKTPSRLINAILIFSVVVGVLCAGGFILASFSTFFILTGQCLTLALPGVAMCLIAIIFAININLQSGELYGF